jgi:hypothetical protein
VAGDSSKDSGRIRRIGAIDARRKRRLLLQGWRIARALGERAAAPLDARNGSQGSHQRLVRGCLRHHGQHRVSQQLHQSRLPALSAAIPLGVAAHLILAETHSKRPLRLIWPPFGSCHFDRSAGAYSTHLGPGGLCRRALFAFLAIVPALQWSSAPSRWRATASCGLSGIASKVVRKMPIAKRNA